MRLTVDLINNSLSYINTLNERELNLRGHMISQIENLGTAVNHDALDLTDNNILQLTGFPQFPRLKTLLLARNRISSIAPTLTQHLPGLTTLILTDNRIQEPADLDPLGRLPSLVHLVVTDNPVTRHEHYRHWVLWRCRYVRYLDYKKVKIVERAEAEQLFGTRKEPTQLAQKIMSSRTGPSKAAATADLSLPPSNPNRNPPSARGSTMDRIARLNLTQEEKTKVIEMVQNAKTESEFAKVEKMLASGNIAGLIDGVDGTGEGEKMDES